MGYENLVLFDILDILTTNFLLPIGGLLIAIFAGWKMKARHSREELALPRDWMYQLWSFLIKFVAPPLVFIVILNLFGVL